MYHFEELETSKSPLFPLYKRGTEGAPIFLLHQLKGTVYFEGNSNRTYELWVNGAKKHTFTLKPNQPYDFDVLIPKELYQNTHRIILSIKNPNNTGVSLAGLSIYRKPEGKSGGGPQSFSDKSLESGDQLIVAPNPFKEKTAIGFTCRIGYPVSINIYDITGRLVRKFSDLIAQSSNQIIWDGCDDTGRYLPNGVYLLELKFPDKSLTNHVILLR
ncbi:MAG: T9SS type A sorting domain-containing protein [candidate division WOR-3 bacterium]